MSKRSTNKPIAFTRQLSELLLVVSLMTVLAFQMLRYEPHEAEKSGLLIILSIGIIGLNVGQFLSDRSVTDDWRRMSTSPLVWAAGLLLIVASLSTIFSINPARSLMGSPSRSQGLLTLVCCVVLFLQAARISDQTERLLVPLLFLITIPVCLTALITTFDLDPYYITLFDRPGSTTGNPVYLASWLVIVLLYVGPRMCRQFAAWKRPYSSKQVARFVIAGVGLLLVGVTLLLSNSRAALIGLATGASVGAAALLAVTKKKCTLAAASVILLIGCVGYILIGQSIDPSAESRLARLFRPYDETRLTMWDGAVSLILHRGEPLVDVYGQPDQWTVLRPWIGYGLETVDMVHDRFAAAAGFEDRFAENVFVDRFHNQLFDVLAMLGWGGSLAWLAIYEAAIYLSLRELGITDRRGVWFLLIQLLTVLLCIVLLHLLLPSTQMVNWVSLLPVGVALGISLGTLLWIVIVTLSPTSERAILSTSDSVTFASLLAIVVCYLIENQFGFTQSASSPLFWVMLGLLVRQSQTPVKEKEVTIPRSLWGGVIGSVGIFLIHSFGASLQSSLVTQRTASPIILIGLLVSVLIVGLLLMPVEDSKRRQQRGLSLPPVVIICSIWIATLIIRQLLNVSASSTLDEIVIGRPDTTARLTMAFNTLAFGGVITIFAAAGMLLVSAGSGRADWVSVMLLIVFVSIGSILYRRGYEASTLHQLAVKLSLASNSNRQFYELSDIAFTAASRYAPRSVDLQLHWATMLLGKAVSESDPEQQAATVKQTEAQKDELLQSTPLIIHAWEWQYFAEQYEAVFRRSPNAGG